MFLIIANVNFRQVERHCQYSDTTMTLKIEPSIMKSTNAIATFTPSIFIVETKDGLSPVLQHEQSGATTTVAHSTKQQNVQRKNGKYINRKFTSPVVSYLAISVAEYSPVINPSAKNGKIIKNTVTLFTPAIKNTP